MISTSGISKGHLISSWKKMIKTVEFTVKAGDGVRARKIAVNDQTVPLINGKGAVELDADTELLAWFSGDAGETLSILGEVVNSNGKKKLVE